MIPITMRTAGQRRPPYLARIDGELTSWRAG